MNIRKKTISSRVIAFVTAAIFILYAIPMSFDEYEAKAAKGSETAKGVVSFPEVEVGGVESSELTHEDTLYDNGNGTYTFRSKIWASYSYSDESLNRAKTQDGCYEISKAGSYLVELWGGDGGAGSQLLSAPNGKGGKGGFVYGVLDVTPDMLKDEYENPKKLMLYYEVGSNGKSITRSGSDGGSGGIGGGAGDITLISVGAGGGYSALYLIDDTDLENGVLKESSKDIPEKVLMIAGGGGGGGASSNIFPPPVGSPDGGNGGTKGTLESTSAIGGFNGTFYSGADGSSSGKKTTFTGKGGTEIPGEVNQSVLGLFDASAYPNDWLKTYHSDGDRGAGGAGNLRGGGGGAGFAGGSGGLQLTAVAAESVGGGGGGSSYISNKIKAWTNTNAVNDSVSRYFTDVNTNQYGGSVIIRYIPSGNNTYEYLKEPVTVSGKISDYFEILPLSNNVQKTGDNTFSASGYITPHISDIVLGEMDKFIDFQIGLKPKYSDSFTGGNDVPVLEGDLKCVSGQDSNNINSTIICDDKVKFLNVPFDYSIKTYSIVKQPGENYESDDLFEAVTSQKTEFIKEITDPHIDGFVPDTSEGVHVYNPTMTIVPASDGKNSLGTPNKNPTVITANAVVQVFSGDSIDVDGLNISAVKNLEYNDGGYDLTVDVGVTPKVSGSSHVIDPLPSSVKANTKNLVEYNYSSTRPITLQNPNDAKPEEIHLTDLEPGYYYFEALGGDGGKGADYILGNKGYGGSGGKGGGVRGIIYLDSKKTINISVGYNGAESMDRQSDQGSNKGGFGGGSTIISVEGYGNIIVAGGGAGGGKGYGGVVTRNNGADGNSSEGLNIIPSTYDKIPSDDSIKKGKDGGSDNTSAAKRQDAVSNYIDTKYVKYTVPSVGVVVPENIFIPDVNTEAGKKDITDVYNFKYIKKTSKPHEGGAVYIEKLAVDCGEYQFFDNTVPIKETNKTVTDSIKNKLDGYIKDIKLSAEFSKYFDIDTDNISVDFSDTDDSSFTESFISDFEYSDGSNDKLDFNINLPYKHVEETVYPVDNGKDKNITTTKHLYTIGNNYKFQIKIRLKPKEGFLGGNDVPLLNVLNVGKLSDFQFDRDYMKAETNTEMSIYHTGNTEKDDDTGYIKRNAVTDWANVEIDTSGFKFEVNDKTVICGTEVKAEDLVNIEKDPYTSSADWQKEFVECTKLLSHKGSGEPLKSGSERIFEDTAYTLSVNIKPKAQAQKAQAQKAQVIASVNGKGFELDANVYVKYKVTYELDHLAVDRVSYKFENPDEEIPYPVTLEDTFRIGDDSSEYQVTIINNSGATLPSTGGIGTTIFYVSGGVLILGAGVVLITKKRMSLKDDK